MVYRMLTLIFTMNIKQKIDTAQQILNAGGNIIKTRDDRELIYVNSEGEVQNVDDCSWQPNKGDDEGIWFQIFG